MLNLNRSCTTFFASLFALTVSAAAAGAATSVSYQQFPSGRPLLPKDVSGSPFKTVAKEYLYGTSPSGTITYKFLFWDKNSKLQTARKLDLHKGDATAWYVEEGGGSCTPMVNCSVGTWEFSLKANHVVAGATPIGSVSVPGLWTPPSTSVSTTTTAAKTIAISARSATHTGHFIDPSGFVDWLMLGAKAPTPGISFSVPAGGSAEAIGFYTTPASASPPPCPPSHPPHTCV
jgi:hypothetical protein